MTIPILHVYGPRWWHDNVKIAGDSTVLLQLRTLIDQALESQTAGGEFFTADGEGFTLVVYCTDDEPHYFSDNALPYSDEMARGTSQDKFWPKEGDGGTLDNQ